jgi:hypothetical protein
MKILRWGMWASLLLLTLAGCSFSGRELVDADQPAQDGGAIPLEPGQPLGQTFVAQHGGLAGIEFFLVPEDGSSRTLTLHLRTDPQAETDIAASSLRLPANAPPGFYRFVLPTIQDSQGQYYYAFLEAAAPGLAMASAGGATYLNGAAYRGHKPLDAQTTFHLVYASGGVLLDLIQAGFGWLVLLAAAGLLFVVPGWALLVLLLPRHRWSLGQLLGVSAGVSLALYPVLFLWTDLVGLHLGALYAWGPVALGLAVLLWHYRLWRPSRVLSTLRQWARSAALWPDLVLVVLLALLFGVRLLVVRTLDAPLWGDSYQHTMMAQLLLDNGGLFNSWEPYTPYQSLTTHFGFPTAAALLAWVTGKDSVQATLLVGQIINGMAALALYPLAVRLARGNRWAGVGAVLVAGLMSPLPAFYVNWGRYAQLAGQAILPAALWLTWEAVERKGIAAGTALLAGLVVAGMMLSYYRMPFYYGTFLLIWLLIWGLPRWRGDARQWLGGFAPLILAGIVAVLLCLPWLPYIAGGRLVTTVGRGLTKPSPLDSVLADYLIWRDITTYLPLPLIIVGLVALVWSLVRRNWVVASLGLWVLALASLVAGQLLRLPGVNKMQNFAVVIALYIPASLLIGWLIGEVEASIEQRMGSAGRWAVGLAITALAVWLARGQTQIVEPQYVMVTRPDMNAAAWIRENTPNEARFLVEGFQIWDGFSAVGADAGWWLPLLAGRENTIPPQYALVNERPVDPGYTRHMVDLVGQLHETSLATAEAARLLCQDDVTHIYIGQGQGNVGAGVMQLFSAADLANNAAFDLVYGQDRVRVYALDPQTCGASSP